MSDWDEHVLPHDPLEQLTPRLWRVRGSVPRMPLPRNMVVWRDDAGRLVLHSVIAVDEPTIAAVTALGDLATIIVPSPVHRLDCGVYKARFPDLAVTCPAAARLAVEQVVPVEGPAEEVLAAHGVTVLSPGGMKDQERVYEVDAGDGTRALVFGDLLFNLEHLPGLQGLILRYVTASTGAFGTTRISRFALVSDRPALAEWLRAQADRGDVGVLLVAHGEPVLGVEECAGKLRSAADHLG